MLLWIGFKGTQNNYYIINRIQLYNHTTFKLIQSISSFIFLYFIKPHEPQDSIDAVCRTHDKCWEEVREAKNCSHGIWEHYDWDIVDEKVTLQNLKEPFFSINK